MAEDVLVGGAVVVEARGQVGDGLVLGQAVDAAVAVVGDDAGGAAARGQDVGVVAAVGHGARRVLHGDVVQAGAAVGGRGRRGGGGGGGRRHGDCSVIRICIGICTLE